MIVSLEGLPGSGKTTAAGNVARLFGYDVLEETTAHHPFLEQVYEDDHRDDLTVELAFLVVHANPYRLLDRSRTTVCDYSPVKDRLFAQAMLNEENRAFFDACYSYVYREHPRPDIVVYMRAAPEVCFARMEARRRRDPRRKFEAGIQLERLDRLEELYGGFYRQLGDVVVTHQVDQEHTAEETAEVIAEQLRAELATRPMSL